MNCLIKPKVKLYMVYYKLTLTTGAKAEGQSILSAHKPVNNKILEDWNKLLTKSIKKKYSYKVGVEALDIVKYENLKKSTQKNRE